MEHNSFSNAFLKHFGNTAGDTVNNGDDDPMNNLIRTDFFVIFTSPKPTIVAMKLVQTGATLLCVVIDFGQFALFNKSFLIGFAVRHGWRQWFSPHAFCRDEWSRQLSIHVF